jgi:hypothetical protein
LQESPDRHRGKEDCRRSLTRLTSIKIKEEQTEKNKHKGLDSTNLQHSNQKPKQNQRKEKERRTQITPHASSPHSARFTATNWKAFSANTTKSNTREERKQSSFAQVERKCGNKQTKH